MFCRKCGNQIPENAKFCPVCGAKTTDSPMPGTPVNNLGTNPVNQGGMMPDNSPYSQNGQGGFNNAGDSQKSNKPIIIAIAAAIGLCVIVGGIVGFLLLSKGSDNDTGTVAKDFGTSESVPDSSDPKDGSASSSDQGSDSSTGADDYDSLLDSLSEYKEVYLELMSYDVTDYPLVDLYVAVEDEYGNDVTLSDPKGAILEQISGGKELEQTIKSITRVEGNQGLSIDIVADKSGSMEYDLPAMQGIMEEFVDSLDYNSGDRAELISFDSYVMYMCTYTNRAELLNNGIWNMSAYGSTMLYDALYEGVQNAGNQEGAKCVIGFTDGDDTGSYHTVNEVINLANTYSVPVYIITTAGGYTSELDSIVDSTGGMLWDISSISDMDAVLYEIYSRQKDMYCITYESDSSKDAYLTREISYILGDDEYLSKADDEFTPVETRKVKNHDNRYEAVVGDVSWSEANEAAIEAGGHLVTITSKKEMNTVKKLAEKKDLTFVWMGGYTSDRYGDIYGHWITGEDFEQYTAWYDGEPSGYDENDGERELYLMLWKVNGKWSWNDQRDDAVDAIRSYSSKKIGYIIEYED